MPLSMVFSLLMQYSTITGFLCDTKYSWPYAPGYCYISIHILGWWGSKGQKKVPQHPQSKPEPPTDSPWISAGIKAKWQSRRRNDDATIRRQTTIKILTMNDNAFHWEVIYLWRTIYTDATSLGLNVQQYTAVFTANENSQCHMQNMPCTFILMWWSTERTIHIVPHLTSEE